MKKNRLAVIIFLIPMAVWSMGGSDSQPADNVGIEPAQDQPKQDDLLTMASQGNAAGVERILKVDVDLNQSDGNGRTALHAVAESGNADIASILISRGISIDPQDNDGKTPLMVAVESSSVEVIERLVDAGADIGISDSSGRTPASAALKKSAEVLAALVNEDNIDSPSVSGQPLLHAAASAGLTDQLSVLLAEGADSTTKDSQGKTALDAALSGSVGIAHARCAARLLQNASPPPKDSAWAYIVEPLRTGNLEIRYDYGSTALHLAAEQGQEGMVRYLLEAGADVDARDEPGDSALHVAVRNGYRTIATLLLDAGSDVNGRDFNGNAPLHESLTAPDGFSIASLLLDRGADPNIKNGAGSTPLHLTVMLGSDVRLPRLLLDRGALVDPRDRSGNTPLLLAVQTENRELAELFLSEGAGMFSRNNKGVTPARGALALGSEAASWFFVGSRLSETDNEGRSALHIAVSMGSGPDVVKMLLETGAMPNLRDFNGESALHYAVEEGRMDTADVLMDYDADPFLENNSGVTPLIKAFELGAAVTIRLLGDQIDIADTWGGTPLFHAVEWKYPAIVAALLDAGADPDHADKQGATALHKAVHTESVRTARLILDAGADPNQGDRMGRTPLHDAVTWGSKDMAVILKDNGANLNAQDLSGQTPLHMAAFSGNDDIVTWLLASGASTEIRNSDGRTPLFLAAEAGRLSTVKLLTARNADLLVRDNNGTTVLHRVIEAGQVDVATYLISHGADIFALDRSGRSAFQFAVEGGPELVDSLVTSGMVNLRDNAGNTLLHLAASYGAGDRIVQILIAKGADVNAVNAMGETPADMSKAALRE